MAKNKLKKIPGHDLKEIDGLTRKKTPKKSAQKKINKPKKKMKFDFNFDYKKVLIIIAIIIVFILILYNLFNIRIKNIYIKGNNILSDQEVIDIAKIRDYPKSFSLSSKEIKKLLEKNKYIKKAKVSKSNFLRTVNIEIEENNPLVYYSYNNKILLADGTEVDEYYDVPILVNQVPDDILKEMLEGMDLVDYDIIDRISEIEYVPNNVDDNLFLLKMSDENYVYVNNKTFKKLNNYLDMVMTFNNKKGILHLDSGDYFTIINEEEK